MISQLKASYTGARVARRRLRIVSTAAVVLLGLLLATTWFANAAYQQLVATLTSRSEVSAVAAISLTEQRSMPEALALAKNALPDPSRWIQASHPLSVSAAVSVFNGLAIGSSEQMAFHIKDADFDPTAQVVATVEGDFTEGNPRTMPHWGRLWSVATGALIYEVRLPKNTSFAVEIIASHRAALYGGFGRELLLWRFGSEETLPFETSEPLAQITEIVSYDDLNIFAVATVNAVHVFDFETGQSVGHTFASYETGHTGKPDHSLDLHPNGAWFAAQTAPGVTVFDFKEKITLCDVSHDGHSFVSIRFTPDGRRLGLISDDGTLFAVDVDETGACSDLRSFEMVAANGEHLCGRFSAEEATTAFVDRKTWVLRFTSERYHADDMYCAYLYDWKEGKTLSTVLLGRGYAPFAQAFLDVDEPHTAHRDLSSLERLGITIASEGLDVFSYRRNLPGGVFIRDRWLRINPNGITLAPDLPQDAMTFIQPVAEDVSRRSWECKGYEAGPSVETVAVSQSGRFAVVAEPNAIRMHDRVTCTGVGVWPISMARAAEFVDNDAMLLVTTAQRQVFRVPMPTSLVDEGLEERLSDVLNQIK
ncbi:WD40 repeat domain-containing protein [Shimia sp. MMG029]|nr:WD40 repeat domain-containing protein [Shimia sp. MMG029]